MLVLGRKAKQTIQIRIPAEHPREVQVKVLKIRGNQVWLGFSAPPDVVIVRGDLEPNKAG